MQGKTAGVWLRDTLTTNKSETWEMANLTMGEVRSGVVRRSFLVTVNVNPVIEDCFDVVPAMEMRAANKWANDMAARTGFRPLVFCEGQEELAYECLNMGGSEWAMKLLTDPCAEVTQING